MSEINIEVYLTKVAPETTTLILKAIAENEYFGLTTGKTTVVFCPLALRSYWIDKSKSIQSGFQYINKEKFIQAISIQLTSHRNFVSRLKLLSDFGLMNNLPTIEIKLLK